MKPFDDYAQNYDALLRDPLRDRFGSDRQFFVRQKCRVVTRRLGSGRKTQPPRLLDAGCGVGTALACFGADVRVFGSDISLPMLEQAVRHGPVAAQDPYALPFADGAFDAVFAFCIYHHIPTADHLKHLRELRRVVADGGEVMVFEHNPYNPITRRIFARAPVDRGCEMIKPSDLRSTFRQAGFSALSQGYLLFVPEALYATLGFLENALAWLPLGGQYFVAGRR